MLLWGDIVCLEAFGPGGGWWMLFTPACVPVRASVCAFHVALAVHLDPPLFVGELVRQRRCVDVVCPNPPLRMVDDPPRLP